MPDLARVRRATVRRERAEAEWRAAVREAHAEGASLREVAAAAGVSHMTVKQVVRGER